MKDIEVYKKFMSWMGMEISIEISIDNDYTLIQYNQKEEFDNDKFTTQGYDEFYSGIIFDKNGNLVKGYLDSHVTYISKNCDLINKIIYYGK